MNQQLSLATRIRITKSRLDALRAGGGEYGERERAHQIECAASLLQLLWDDAELIARPV